MPPGDRSRRPARPAPWCRGLRIASMLWPSLLSAGVAQANEAGDWVAQAGWFFIAPHESSDPLRTELTPTALGELLGIGPEFESPGTAASVDRSDTLALTLTYFVTDHLAIKAESGIPARFDLRGEGLVRPTGPAGALIGVDLGAPANNPLARARQWSPALLLQYYFFEPQLRLRPFVGVGATYTWFTDIELNPSFRDEVQRNFGAPLALAAGAPGPTHAEAESSPSWAPIFNAGLAYALDERWGVLASVSHVPLKTTSTIVLSAADGTRLARSETTIDLDPIVTSLLLSYRF